MSCEVSEISGGSPGGV